MLRQIFLGNELQNYRFKNGLSLFKTPTSQRGHCALENSVGWFPGRNQNAGRASLMVDALLQSCTQPLVVVQLCPDLNFPSGKSGARQETQKVAKF